MIRKIFLCLLLVWAPALAGNSAELEPGKTIESGLSKGKTTIVEFYADW